MAAKKAAIELAKKAAQLRKKAADQAKAIAQRALQQTKKTGNPVQKQAQARANPAGASAAKSGGGGKSGSGKTGGTDGASSRSKGGTSGSGSSGKTSSGNSDSGGGGASCPRHSFAPGTQVLMADGSRKAIEKVRIGDKVVAFDPATGKRSVRAVTVLHTNRDTDLTDVTVKIERRPGARTGAGTGVGAAAGDGQERSVRQTMRRVALALAPAAAAAVMVLAPAAPAHANDSGTAAQNAGVESTTAVVNTTAHHPFWNLTTNTWTNATDLNPGDQLQPDTTNTPGTSSSARGADGGMTTVTVTRIDNHTTTRTMHDLTIDTIHTYHVLAGKTPVLVHNCGTIDPSTVRFSQKGVSANFANGNSIEDAAVELRNGNKSAWDFPVIRLVERDGNLHTLDNRRLVAFQKAGLSEVPYRMATPEEIMAESWKFDRGTDGTSIKIRGGGGVWKP